MNLTSIDAWIGKTLFLPLIVKLCQATGQSQFAVSRLFWFVAALDQLRVADTLVGQVIAGLFSLFMMATAALRANAPAISMLGFRMLTLVLFALDVTHGVLAGQWKGVEIWIFVLFAEYAATIRTIPPADTKRSSATKRASQRS